MNAQVNRYIESSESWRESLLLLRQLMQQLPLEEQFKWRTPTYAYQGQNLFMIADAGSYCALSFLKGSLLRDSDSLLETPGEYSRAVRLIKLESSEHIRKIQHLLKQYLQEAIELEKSGAKVDFEKDRELPYPDELVEKMDGDPQFAEAFLALTPGRQRGYIMHFSKAKQAKTRVARIEKFYPRILQGKGMMDCVCGLSKRMPNCDGSHRQLKNPPA